MPLKLIKRGEVYYLRGSVQGRAVYQSTKTSSQREAKALLEATTKQIFNESVYGPRRTVSFMMAATSYLAFQQRSPTTALHVERLMLHFGDTLLSKIGQAEADAAVEAILKPHAKPATKDRAIYTPLAAIQNHGAERKWCDRPRYKKPAKTRGRTRWLTPDEAQKLLKHAAPHVKPLIHFILCTGARMSEAIDLCWEDVDLEAKHVVFRDTKNGLDRVALLPPAARLLLANLGGTQKKGSVFRRPDGLPYIDKERTEGGQIKKAWATACRKAEIGDWKRDALGNVIKVKHKGIWQHDATPHVLRHSFATYFYVMSKDLLLLKDEGGWRTLEMVERYTHLAPLSILAGVLKVWGGEHPRIAGTRANHVQKPKRVAKNG